MRVTTPNVEPQRTRKTQRKTRGFFVFLALRRKRLRACLRQIGIIVIAARPGTYIPGYEVASLRDLVKSRRDGRTRCHWQPDSHPSKTALRLRSGWAIGGASGSSVAFLFANVLPETSWAERFVTAFAVFRMTAANFPTTFRTAGVGRTVTSFHFASHRFKPLRFAPPDAPSHGEPVPITQWRGNDCRPSFYPALRRRRSPVRGDR